MSDHPPESLPQQIYLFFMAFRVLLDQTGDLEGKESQDDHGPQDGNRGTDHYGISHITPLIYLLVAPLEVSSGTALYCR